MKIHAMARLSELAASKEEMMEVYTKAFEVMKKHGAKYLSHVVWTTDTNYSCVNVEFRIDMDDVPESLTQALVACKSKNVSVDPCQRVSGSGIIRIK